MKIKDIKRGNPSFTTAGSFGAFDPLIEPHILSKVKINPNGSPVVLHVISAIQASKEINEFSFQIEENIQIDAEGEALNPKDLLEVVIEAGKRCFRDAYDSSVRDSITFPFVRMDPQMDYDKILSDIIGQIS